MEIVALLTDQDNYTKTRNYWKYLKAKLKKENSQVVSATTRLKLPAADSKNLQHLSGITQYKNEKPNAKKVYIL